MVDRLLKEFSLAMKNESASLPPKITDTEPQSEVIHALAISSPVYLDISLHKKGKIVPVLN
jgi:hypothetical protein